MQQKIKQIDTVRNGDLVMKEIVCFGDSNTYGLIPATTERYAYGVRWSSILEQKIKSEQKEYWIQEEGLCGRTTVFDDPFRENRRGSQMLPALLETHRPIDLLILMLGTNDCKEFYKSSAEMIGKGIVHLLDQVEMYAKGTKILLISPIHLGEKVFWEGFDPEFSIHSIEVSKELSAVYRRIAKERGLLFLDAATVAQSSPIDQEHLDEAGHKALAEAIYKKLFEEKEES